MFLFVALLSLHAAEPKPQKPTVAVLPLMAPDLLEPQKRAIDERIRTLAADNGVALQAAGETQKNLEKAKGAGAGCNLESLACQAQMGVLLGMKEVLVARVASDWAGDRLELRLLDALRGSTLRETTQLLPKDPALRTRVIDGAVLRIFAPKKTGSVVVTAPAGAPVFLDGVALTAQQAQQPIEGLIAGPHDVELRPEGKPGESKRVVVEAGKSVAVQLGPQDAPPPPPPEPSPLGWIVLGSGAALATVAVAGAGGLQAALEYTPMERATRGALQVTGLTLLGATAVGVAVAGAGGALVAVEAMP